MTIPSTCDDNTNRYVSRSTLSKFFKPKKKKEKKKLSNQQDQEREQFRALFNDSQATTQQDADHNPKTFQPNTLNTSFENNSLDGGISKETNLNYDLKDGNMTFRTGSF